MIRPAGLADVEAVLALWAEATVPSISDDAHSIAALLDHDPGALLVAEVDGALVGTLIATTDGWRCYLYRLAVHPDYRRRGIGALLVAAGERRLAGGRTDALVLDDDEQAHAFWRALGYGPDPRLTRWVKLA